MSVQRPANKELKDLESFLDNQCNSLFGSDFYTDLETIYTDLDAFVSEYKETIDELKDKVEELEARLEELE